MAWLQGAAIRTRWVDVAARLSATGDASKMSQAVAFGRLEEYDSLSADERPAVDRVLQDWMDSDDNRLRYDAKFLTSQRCIRAMKPAVEKAIAKCEKLAGPEAPDEAQDLRRILVELETV